MKKYYRVRKGRTDSGNICLFIVLPRRERKTRRNYVLYLEFRFTGSLVVPDNHKRVTTLGALQGADEFLRWPDYDRRGEPAKILSSVLEWLLNNTRSGDDLRKFIRRIEYET